LPENPVYGAGDPDQDEHTYRLKPQTSNVNTCNKAVIR
jgi:hypothetical protein